MVWSSALLRLWVFSIIHLYLVLWSPREPVNTCPVMVLISKPIAEGVYCSSVNNNYIIIRPQSVIIM